MLTMRHGEYILRPIAMSSKLQPSIELTVMMQQYAGAIVTHDQSAAGKMCRERLPSETIATIVEELDHSFPIRLFLRPVGKVKRSESGPQFSTIHLN
jgi:hypothetical protein